MSFDEDEYTEDFDPFPDEAEADEEPAWEELDGLVGPGEDDE
jgi:hypothetical protein